MQELYLTLSQVVDTLGQELGRSPNIAELAAEVQASEEDVLEALEAGQAYRFASLDAPAPTPTRPETLGDGSARRTPSWPGPRSGPPSTRCSRQLPHRQRQVVQLRFFEGLTQSEIARRLGISQMQVSRLLTTSVAQLRSLAKEPVARAGRLNSPKAQGAAAAHRQRLGVVGHRPGPGGDPEVAGRRPRGHRGGDQPAGARHPAGPGRGGHRHRRGRRPRRRRHAQRGRQRAGRHAPAPSACCPEGRPTSSPAPSA